MRFPRPLWRRSRTTPTAIRPQRSSVFRRTYPEGTLAAHVLGHLGAASSGGQTTGWGGSCTATPGATVQLSPQQQQTGMSAPPVGRMGVERQYEAVLRGQPGVAVQQFGRGGHAVRSYCRQEPVAGRDLQLTLDVRLQRTAEDLLQSALKRGQNCSSEKGTGPICAKHPPGRSGKLDLSPFPRAGRSSSWT